MSDPSRPPRFGAHMPTTGGLDFAIRSGKEVGCELVQVFTKSPHQWRAREISDEEVKRFLQAQEETGVRCIVSHDTYLINPASPDPELLAKSREALAEEMIRCGRLGIPLVVMHLGTQGDGTPEEALERLTESVRQALEKAPEGVTLLLETMAGQGKTLGRSFEELAYVLDRAQGGDRLGVCLDTCHVFAAGYDLRDADAVAKTLNEFDRVVGLEHLKLIHANDSRKGLGSRVDRHDHIGAGCIGQAGFAALLTEPRLAHIPVILETPKEGEMDPVNLAALRKAAGVEDPAQA